jgi:glutamyl-tRNA synthetase
MRVRFAPSPTGYLHVGGARTALYNWLLAQKEPESALVLRIEDTDRERSTDEAIEQIIDGLRWLGLDWDEGPYRQTERTERYAQHLDALIASGRAYFDTATAEDVKREKEGKPGRPGYRGTPSPEGAPGAGVRLRVPDEGVTVVEDVIRGSSSFENRLLDDFVIARADSTPLYNFAVAVDDLEMGITHVVRGEDHLSNTPRQLLVLAALGAKPPVYSHLPLLHGLDGKPLSKRHGAVSVQEFRRDGFLPEAVVNYLALLGWGYDETTTLFTVEELIEKFSLERVSRSPAVFDEQKLRWINGQYIRQLDSAELAERLRGYLAEQGHPAVTDVRLQQAAAAVAPKISTLAEFLNLVGFAFEAVEIDERAWDKVMKKEGAGEALRRARDALGEVDRFDEPEIESALRGVVDDLGVKPGAVFQPVRVAITGRTVSAGVFESLALLGREEALARIDAALARV